MAIDIDWGAFVVVFGVALAATAVVVGSFALGIRLMANGRLDPAWTPDDSARPAAAGGPAGQGAARTAAAAPPRPLIVTLGSGLCFAIGVFAVLTGLWLAIPQFH